jgi:hypothetical protein
MPTNFLRARPARTAVIAILVAAAVVAAGLASRGSNAKRLEQSAAARSVPSVSLVPAIDCRGWDARAAGPRRAMVPRTDLRPRQRLPA